ncbi:MAG TPA: hypothetical protein VFU47_06280, partial [Armatimonadota bacterium]|nr:hypothetical protein [Armatimonadota bacterium]
GKWDPMVLPWDPGRPREAVGAGFRESVRFLLDGGTFDLPDADQLPPISVSLDGALLTDEGLLQAGASWCPLRPLAEALGWSLLELDRDTAVIATPGGRVRVAAMVRADRGYVRLRDLAARLGWPPPAWDAPGRIVRLQARRDPP